MGTKRQHFFIDLFLILVSIFLAVYFSGSGGLDKVLNMLGSARTLESLVAGLFFTSAFTTAFSIAAFAHIGASAPIFSVAIFGALGAVVGDLILFTFVRDRLSDDVRLLVGKSLSNKLTHIAHSRVFRWFSPFLGALIIASPLPDELGISILGLANLRRNYFLAFAFFANFFGILAVLLITSAV